MKALLQSNIPNLPLRRGKVRDVYDLGDSLLIVASDRISAFDVILPTGIPDKGSVLTQLSNFWFNKFAKTIPNHILATDIRSFPALLKPYAADLEGRSIVVRKTKVIPIECVVRGYITGGGWKEYQKLGSVSGITLPPGMKLCQQLAEPIFTPTTKADQGHDQAISFGEVQSLVGADIAGFIRDQSIALYQQAAAYALSRGIIIADTKFEWGIAPNSTYPILIDEILTPDSSRFWPAAQYQPGHEQASFDKQYVRNYLETLSWNKTPPGPTLPDDIVLNTRSKYVEAFERLTARRFGM